MTTSSVCKDSTPPKTKRVAGYDIAKCLAMLLVILIHYSFYSTVYPATKASQFLTTVTVIGVPTFFMVNGALLLSRPLDVRRHYLKTLRMLVILIIWKALSAFTMGLLIGTNPLNGGLRAFIAYLLFGNLDGFNLGYFWFMYALMAIYLVYPVFKACFDGENGTAIILAICLILIALVFGVQALSTLQEMLGYFFGLPSVDLGGLSQIDIFGQYGYALAYFLLGGLIHERLHNGSDVHKPSAVICLLVFAVSWVCLAAVQLYQQKAFDVVFYVKDGYTDIITLVMTCSLFTALSQVKLSSPTATAIATSLGSNTLGVYFLHLFAITLVFLFVAPFTGVIDSLAVNIGIVVLIYLACHLSSLLFRHIPILGKLFQL